MKKRHIGPVLVPDGICLMGSTCVALSQNVTVDSDNMMQFKLRRKKNLTAERIEFIVYK